MRVAVAGATGYVGGELLRYLALHKAFDVSMVTSEKEAGRLVNTFYPSLPMYRDLRFQSLKENDDLKAMDVVFLSLPAGEAHQLVPELISAGVTVVDLSADFRLRNVRDYETWYHREHLAPEYVEQAVYGLSEWQRPTLPGAKLIANPGCYPTATLLGAMPLVSKHLVETEVIIDAKSGISGAGKGLKEESLFVERSDNLQAYGLAGVHRHVPEIEQGLSAFASEEIRVAFTPHLIPMNRGMLVTAYYKLRQSMTETSLAELYREVYQDEPFVAVVDHVPGTKEVMGTNRCHLHVSLDRRTSRVIVVSVIDNLGKGAAGQAVQNANLALGISEIEGVNLPAMVP